MFLIFFIRHKLGEIQVIVVLNFGETTESINIQNLFDNVPSQMRVLVSSVLSHHKEG